MNCLEKIQASLATIPLEPGCYLWYGENDRGQEQVLYVGKALSLRKRVRQYLHSQDFKTRFLMNRVCRVEWMVTQNEVEALLLENNLIKKHNPPYNVRLKDDKSYPYLCLTLGEPFPRLILTRRKNNPAHAYFGPYTDVVAARNTMALILRIFPVRKRSLRLPLKQPAKPCLNYHIGRCWGPCSGQVAESEYRAMIGQIADFLAGHSDAVEQRLREEMLQHAQKREYEKAARLRNILQDIASLRGEQQVHAETPDLDYDIVGVYTAPWEELQRQLDLDSEYLNYLSRQSLENLGQIVLLRVRHGNVVSKRSYAMSESAVTPGLHSADLATGYLAEAGLLDTQQEFVEAFLREYYLEQLDLPGRLVLSSALFSARQWQETLSKRSGHAVEIITPPLATESSGSNYSGLLAMALTNARLSLRERILSEKMRNQKHGLRQIQKILNLPALPKVIECYDISNFQGKEAVGSGVMLRDGIPYKPGYRKYRIRMENEPNDPAMIHEVLSRRMQRIASRQVAAPDLVVIDGGITQLRAALKARDAAGLQMAMIGLAKQEEEIYLPDGRILKPHADSPGMLLLRLARDEAHRFAVAYHRLLRKRRNLASVLDEISGVADKDKRELLSWLRTLDQADLSLPRVKEQLCRQYRLSEITADQVLQKMQEVRGH